MTPYFQGTANDIGKCFKAHWHIYTVWPKFWWVLEIRNHFDFLLILFVCSPIFPRLSMHYTDHQKSNKQCSKINISLKKQRSSLWGTWAYLSSWRKKSCFFKFKFCVGPPLGGCAEFPSLSSFLRRNHLIKRSLHYFFRFLISKHFTWQRRTREPCRWLRVSGSDEGSQEGTELQSKPAHFNQLQVVEEPRFTRALHP